MSAGHVVNVAVSDTVRSLLHRPPKTVAPDWRNELAARSLWSLIRYRPAGAVARVSAPLLVCVADADTAASVPLVLRAAAKAPRGQTRRYPGGHFGAYLGTVFEQMVTDETEFLRHHLLTLAPHLSAVREGTGVS